MDNLKKIGPRYKNLSNPRERINTTDKVDPFKVKREALSYCITESLNELARPKKSFLPVEQMNRSALRPSNMQMTKIKQNEATRKLDTYAKMLANNNKQCSNRIKRLARPKRRISEDDHLRLSDLKK